MNGVVACRGREPALPALLHGLARMQYRAELVHVIEQFLPRPPFHTSSVISPSQYDGRGRE